MNLHRLENAKLKAQVEELKHANKRLHADLWDMARKFESFRTARRPVKLHIGRAQKRTRKDIIRVIVPDSHGAKIDRRAAAAFLADLAVLDPDEVVMLGDHVDCGGFLAEHHTLGYVAQTDYSYFEDTEHANQFLDEIQKRAPRADIDYLEGNHERRTETWAVTKSLSHKKDAEMLRRMVSPEFLLNLKQRGIRYYRQSETYHGLSVPGCIKKGKVHFWHGTSCAANAAAVNLAQVGGNIVFGHTHRAQALPTRDVANGDHGAWNPGCLCELQPLWQHGRPTTWTHGYAIQLVAPSGNFLHINIGIVDGSSLMVPLLSPTSLRKAA